MKTLVLGAGGIGGYFGGRLVQAGADVTFLVRENRKKLLDTNGMRIRSTFGDFTGPVRTVLKEQAAQESWDTVILTCKAYDLDSALDTIRPAVGQGTAVLPLLNGLAHMDRLNAEFGQANVLGGLAKIVSMVDGEGVIHHLNDWCSLVFGEQDGVLSQRVLDLRDAFPKGSVRAEAVPDIKQKMWEKLVHLATVAGAATLMRANVGEIASVPGGTEFLISFLESNAALAKKEGYPISDAFLDEYRKLFHDVSSEYVPSLLRDLERRNKIEGEHIIGHLLTLARKNQMDTSLLDLMNLNLRAYEVRLADNRF